RRQERPLRAARRNPPRHEIAPPTQPRLPRRPLELGSRPMAAQAATRWTLKGTVLIACNCDFGCPCNFNALPSKGFCEGGWVWCVEEGRFGETPLDGLAFTVIVKWPGAIHEGGGEGVVLVDERADDAQLEAVATLVGGDV